MEQKEIENEIRDYSDKQASPLFNHMKKFEKGLKYACIIMFLLCFYSLAWVLPLLFVSFIYLFILVTGKQMKAAYDKAIPLAAEAQIKNVRVNESLKSQYRQADNSLKRSTADELEKLQMLKVNNVISDAEFESEKAKLLAS